jgi:ABC-type transport system involved in multi-copper enzyme maturation permease subunit
MKKFLSILLFILSPMSLVAAFVTTVLLSSRFPTASAGEAMYHTARFVWVFFLLMLIPLGCMIYGIGLNFKKNLVAGIIFSALLLLYSGIMSFALSRYSADPAYLDQLETEIGIQLPDGMTVVRENWTGGHQTSSDDYLLRYDSVARFASDDEATAFMQEADTSIWLTDKTSIAESIPTLSNVITDGCDYFLLYCYETAAFNEATSQPQYTYVYMAVDAEAGVLYITEFVRK